MNDRHQNKSRRRNSNIGCAETSCQLQRSSMTRLRLKRSRYGATKRSMAMIALAALPATRARLRSSRRLYTCYRYPNSPESVSPYLPSYSYNPSQLATNEGLIYECKPFPFNGWCGDYEPGDPSKPWGDAWILVGPCVWGDDANDEIKQQSSGTVSNEVNPYGATMGLPPCSTYPPFSSVEIYAAEDVLYHNGRTYKCKIAPADAWCSLDGYEPGTGMYWSMAWEELGECFVDEIVGNSHQAGSGRPISFPESSGSTLEPCGPLYSSTERYGTQSLISFEQYNYQCQVPMWCNQESYAPRDGNTMTAAAWSKKGQCEGIVTALPSQAPAGPTEIPTEIPTPKPMEWVEISNEIVLQFIEDEPSALAFLVPEEQETIQVRTRRPSKLPTQAPAPSNIKPCAPLFTQGREYELKELISFNGYNYRCEVTDQCSNVRYAPRTGHENTGIAWWKIGQCHGTATRHPTPPPTPVSIGRNPTVPDKVEEARRNYYSSRVPMPILRVLNENRPQIQKSVLISQTPDWEWEYSSLYNFDDFVVALGVMSEHPVINHFFLGGFGTQSSEEAVLYGLVNIAAFLSQAMVESIKFDTCDEANWDFVNNYYPLSNACGQGGLSYQDMVCSEEEKHMECPVKKDMKMTALTSAKWLGGADGAPGPLYCAPKSNSKPFSGVWDHLYKCNRPHEDPPEMCDVYEGQSAGRYDNSFPAGNRASRSDVEGCCWWGRGVIQTRGVCDIGKINHFLGKDTENSPYPDLDFCENPEALCSNTLYSELKWVAGMASWTMRVQSYNLDGWGFIPQLIKFVDEGMVDDSFIEAISGILTRGCHDDSCGEIEPSYERTKNFKMILEEVFDIQDLSVEAGRTFTPTSKPTKRTRKPVEDGPTSKPTRRSRRPTARPTSAPTFEVTTEMPTDEPTTLSSLHINELEPSLRPTEWRPWYYNYDTQTCVNDGDPPQWLEQVDFFGVKDECCKKKKEANYDICMGRVTYKWSAHNAKVEVLEDGDECPPSTGWAASTDCHSYFMCQNGVTVGPIYNCADGLLFDEEVSECKPQSEVNCSPQENAMMFKSETFSGSRPTKRPAIIDRPLKNPRPNTRRPSTKNTRRPTPTPFASSVSQNDTPIASLWFGVSVTTKIKDNGDSDGMPQDRY